MKAVGNFSRSLRVVSRQCIRRVSSAAQPSTHTNLLQALPRLRTPKLPSAAEDYGPSPSLTRLSPGNTMSWPEYPSDSPSTAAELPQVEQMAGGIGARVTRADLCAERSLSPPAIDTIRQALLAYGVLVFPGLTALTEEQLVRVTGYFGEPQEHKRGKIQRPDRKVKEVVLVSNMEKEGLGSHLLPFHSDMSYVERPAHVTVLHCMQAVDQGGETSFADTQKSYEELPKDLLDVLTYRTATHRHPVEWLNPPQTVSHPITPVHPISGKRVVYISPFFTHHIDGVSSAESAELMELVHAHTCQPRFVYMHRWKPGDLVIWDNRSTMHRREAFDPSVPRYLKRSHTVGNRPTWT